MGMIAKVLMDEVSEARRQLESHCQSLVNAGTARWWINDDGNAELRVEGGEVYLFGDQGATRLR